MNQSYRLVVFDWEGTLGDTYGQIVSAMAKQAEALQFGSIDTILARQYIVLGPVVAVKKLFPDLSAQQQSELMQATQNALVLKPTPVCIMPGARAILHKIRQNEMFLAIATNKGQNSLLRDLELSGLTDFFTVTRSAGQVPAKPCPQMLEEIMDVCGVTAAQTLMIGDSLNDIEMAQQANVAVIGVDFYRQNESVLRGAGAMDVYYDFQQLADYLALS